MPNSLLNRHTTLAKQALLLLAMPLASALSIHAAEAPVPTSETPAQRDARMNWWRDARFGMFIHYGLYSGLEGDNGGKPVSPYNTEWHQVRLNLDTDTYAALAKPKFKPAPGCAESWAKLAKEAGCRYVVLTTKHHEGFDLFETTLNDYNAKALTGRDIVREYADAAHAAGLHVGFYHSLIDWHNADYDFNRAKGLPYPKDNIKLAGNKPLDQSKYIALLHDQVVNELMSKYGRIGVLWFDFSSKDFYGDEAWGATKLLRDIHAKQPGIIINNRLGGGTGDFDTPEQHIPENGIPGSDWETCMTINNTWGYSKYDANWKTSKQLIQNLCDTVSKGGNYLLNIGPKGDGSIPPETVDRMKAIGAWMKINGEAIYGTTASPFPEKLTWGRVTRKGDTLNLLVFERPKNGAITLPLSNGSGATAALLDGGATLKTVATEGGLEITLPEKLKDENTTVVVLKLKGAPVVIKR